MDRGAQRQEERYQEGEIDSFVIDLLLLLVSRFRHGQYTLCMCASSI